MAPAESLEDAGRKKVVSKEPPEDDGLWEGEPDWASLPAPLPPPAERFCILFIGASNSDEAKLSLEREVKKIEEKFTKEWGADTWRNIVTFKHFFFADMEQLVQGLLDYKPVGVHFVCHGFKSALSLYRDLVSVDRLREALAAWAREAGGARLRFAIANLCDSARLAKVLAEHVDFVVGHHKPVRDEDAVKFAEVLYRSLGSGMPLKSSFDLAKSASGSAYCLQGSKDATKFAFSRPLLKPSQVHVKTTSGRSVAIPVEPGDTIDTLKRKIQDDEVLEAPLHCAQSATKKLRIFESNSRAVRFADCS